MSTLVEIQLAVLLARDAAGCLVATRDPDPQPAPRVFLGRSRERNVWPVRADVAPALRREIDSRLAAEPPLAEPRADAPPQCREALRALLCPIEAEWRGPAYVLPDALPTDDRAREVSGADAALWRDAFPWLEEHFDALAPATIAFAEGRAAALCHAPRGRTARAAEAGVETLPPFRGRGLATAAVACWARAVQRSGRLALYSTSWENTASQALARRLGARLYGENWQLR